MMCRCLNVQFQGQMINFDGDRRDGTRTEEKYMCFFLSSLDKVYELNACFVLESHNRFWLFEREGSFKTLPVVQCYVKLKSKFQGYSFLR